MFATMRTVKTGLVLLAVGTVSAAAAPVVWHLRGHDGVVAPAAVLPQAPAPDVPDLNIAPVLALAPFGATPTDTGPAVAQTKILDFSLLGVIVRDDPKRSMALIKTPKGEANFRTGDALTDTTTLTQVAPAFVMLDIEGVKHRLDFSGAALAQTQDDVPSGADRLLSLITSGVGTTISEQVDQALQAQPQTTQDYIEYWRKQIQANPAQVLDSIGLVPTENGYRIAAEHDSGVNRAGLREGDVVQTVNGQQVGDIDSDRALYDQVAASGLARIEIERDGRIIVMSFPLQ